MLTDSWKSPSLRRNLLLVSLFATLVTNCLGSPTSQKIPTEGITALRVEPVVTNTSDCEINNEIVYRLVDALCASDRYSWSVNVNGVNHNVNPLVCANKNNASIHFINPKNPKSNDFLNKYPQALEAGYDMFNGDLSNAAWTSAEWRDESHDKQNRANAFISCVPGDLTTAGEIARKTANEMENALHDTGAQKGLTDEQLVFNDLSHGLRVTTGLFAAGDPEKCEKAATIVMQGSIPLPTGDIGKMTSEESQAEQLKQLCQGITIPMQEFTDMIMAK